MSLLLNIVIAFFYSKVIVTVAVSFRLRSLIDLAWHLVQDVLSGLKSQIAFLEVWVQLSDLDISNVRGRWENTTLNGLTNNRRSMADALGGLVIMR